MNVATSSGTAKVTTPGETQILITREFNASKNLVFRAYTEPALVRRWWHGGHGDMKVCEIDLRVGGKWRYAMDVEGVGEVAFHGEFKEIVPNEKIVSTEAYEGAPDPDDNATLNTVTLTERDGVTFLECIVDCPSKFVRDMIIESGMEGGLQKSYDLLEQTAVSLR